MDHPASVAWSVCTAATTVLSCGTERPTHGLWVEEENLDPWCLLDHPLNVRLQGDDDVHGVDAREACLRLKMSTSSFLLRRYRFLVALRHFVRWSRGARVGWGHKGRKLKWSGRQRREPGSDRASGSN